VQRKIYQAQKAVLGEFRPDGKVVLKDHCWLFLPIVAQFLKAAFGVIVLKKSPKSKNH
jgi:hypothetical protein